MRKIKVLQVGLSSQMGGIESYVATLCQRIDRNAFSLDFLVIGKEPLPIENDIKALGGHIYHITPRFKNYFKSYKEIRNIIENNQYDFIHYHIMSYSWFEPVVIAQKFSKASIILHSHSTNNQMSEKIRTSCIHRIGERKIKDKRILRVGCTEESGRWLFKDKPFTVLLNGIDTKRFQYHKESSVRIRKELGITENTTVLGHIGRFAPVKNHTFLIDIFYEYQKKNPDSVLLLLGSGELKETIQNKIESYQIQNKVFLLGVKKETEQYLSVMDLFILPSIYEGLPFTILEASASGLNCLVSKDLEKNLHDFSNVHYCSLEDSLEHWVLEIENLISENTHEHIPSILPQYDLACTMRALETFYIDHVSKEEIQ